MIPSHCPGAKCVGQSSLLASRGAAKADWKDPLRPHKWCQVKSHEVFLDICLVVVKHIRHHQASWSTFFLLEMCLSLCMFYVMGKDL